MQSQWIQSKGELNTREHGLYGGIFTDRPLVIAQSIKRPLTPFINHINFINPNVNTKKILLGGSNQRFEFTSSYNFNEFDP